MLKCMSIRPNPITCALNPGHAGKHVDLSGNVWADGPQPVKKPRAPRSDKGKSRKVEFVDKEVYPNETSS